MKADASPAVRVKRQLRLMRLADLGFEPAKTTRAFAESIRKDGVLEPLLVSAGDRVVRDGRRRASAALEAGISTVPVYLLEGTPAQCESWTIIANVHRSRNLASELRALRALIDQGEDRDSIEAQLGLYKKDSKRLFALLQLIAPAEALLASGTLSPSTAMVLAGLTKEQQQEFLAELGDGKATLAAAKAFRLRVQYAPQQLTFLTQALPEVRVNLP